MLALDEPDASILADFKSPVVWEYTEAQFLELKKKLQATKNDFVPSRQPRQPPMSLVESAAPAGLPTTLPATGAEVPSVPSVELLVTSESPPPEPLLEAPAPKAKRGT